MYWKREERDARVDEMVGRHRRGRWRMRGERDVQLLLEHPRVGLSFAIHSPGSTAVKPYPLIGASRAFHEMRGPWEDKE